jgi:hypothetical protein
VHFSKIAKSVVNLKLSFLKLMSYIHEYFVLNYYNDPSDHGKRYGCAGKLVRISTLHEDLGAACGHVKREDLCSLKRVE